MAEELISEEGEEGLLAAEQVREVDGGDGHVRRGGGGNEASAEEEEEVNKGR